MGRLYVGHIKQPCNRGLVGTVSTSLLRPNAQCTLIHEHVMLSPETKPETRNVGALMTRIGLWGDISGVLLKVKRSQREPGLAQVIITGLNSKPKALGLKAQQSAS